MAILRGILGGIGRCIQSLNRLLTQMKLRITQQLNKTLIKYLPLPVVLGES